MTLAPWLCLLAMPPIMAASEQPHLFQVKDSIEMVRFSDPSGTDLNAQAKYSPDGRFFFIVTSRGILFSNKVESTLWIYRTQDVIHSMRDPNHGYIPRPKNIAQVAAVPQVIATAPYESMILDARWSADSRSIYFLAQDNAGNRRLSEIDLGRRQTKFLSPPRHDVYQYALSSRTILFCALTSPQSEFAHHLVAKSSSSAVTGLPLDDLILNDKKFAAVTREVWIVHRDTGKRLHLAPLDERQHFTADTVGSAMAVSPDGRRAILPIPVRHIPESWANFQPASGQEHQRIDPTDSRRIDSADLNFNRLVEFAVIDLHDGSISRLGAPMARQLGYFGKSEAVWSTDAGTVILTNTFLPFGSAHQRELRTRPCVAAILRVATSEISCLAFFKSDPVFSDQIGNSQVQDAAFGKDRSEVLLLVGKDRGSKQVRTYRREGERWGFIGQSETIGDEGFLSWKIREIKGQLPRVSIHQTLNERPALWAEWGTHSMLLWDPNPQLDTMALGETVVVTWKDKRGNEWTGGLVKPPGYTFGRRYPLVIQMYQFHQHEFMTDGMATTAMAARPLASAGMMFLQITKRSHSFDQLEMEDHLEGILSAIDTLDERGLINPRKVGIIGFSATCPYVEYALIKAPSRFAAATIADGIDNSYMQAMLWGTSNVGIQEQYRRINGVSPFGNGLERWLQVAPNFQLAKVKTPLRIEAIRPASLLSEWELYSSLSQQKKPVDLIYLPDGQHILQKPGDRMVSQQGNVDWFRFWLLGEEDPEPQDRDEYRRWRSLEKMAFQY